MKEIQPYAVGVFFALIYLAEHLLPQRRDLIDYKHDFFNVMTGLLNLIIAGFGGYAMIYSLTYVENKDFGLLNYLPFYLHVVFGLLISDVYMYWWHRLNHELPFLWRFHQFHHT
ncbi:MAG: sterol desaturase family protein, partial [Daejeonella sp.]|uniref:sterol desaturase family protein n=1 Tax=Daejeonella sp. TaxID=2805397 RepID=UPI003C78ECE6